MPKLAIFLFAITLRAADPAPADVDKIFAAYAKQASPGCALGVIRDGALIYTRGYGEANIDYHLPLHSRSVIYIASTSKQFTAASILLLERDGKLSLDDNIRKYVPEIPDYGQPITIRNLIHHTSGLRDYLALIPLAAQRTEDVRSDEEVLALVARQKNLNFKPGERHLYSNTGYWLLSVIAKRVSGKSLNAYATEKIFRPLGMDDTQFYDDHKRIVPRRVTGYEIQENGHLAVVSTLFDRVGDGGLLTTIDDLVKWDRMFYTDSLAPGLAAQLQKTGQLKNGDPLQYASGLMVSERGGLRQVAHGGSFNGFRAELVRFPEKKFSVVCLCNRYDINPTNLANKVVELYLGIPAPVPPAPPAASPVADIQVSVPQSTMQSYVGDYYSDELDATYHFSLQDGKLGVSLRTAPWRNLNMVKLDSFSRDQMQFEFTRSGDGRAVDGFWFTVGGRVLGRMRFVRK